MKKTKEIVRIILRYIMKDYRYNYIYLYYGIKYYIILLKKDYLIYGRDNSRVNKILVYST